MNRNPTRVVLDTDIGTDVDDALALVLALASPEIDVIGVTVVDGDVDVRARMAARLLGMAGRPDIPVLMGESNPLGEGRMPTGFGHEGEGLLDLPWDGPEAEILTQPAPEWIVDQSHQNPFHLVAVGPFTNVAKAVLLDPSLPSRVHHLTVMGGMVHSESYDPQWQDFFEKTGLAPNHLDHNTACDLEAARIMALAGFEMTWVTAELTFCTTLDGVAASALTESGSALGDRLLRMINIWSERWFRNIPNFPNDAEPFPPGAVAALHDPLAVAAVFGGDWLTTRPHNLQFGTTNKLFKTIEVGHDQSSRADLIGAGGTHDVSIAVDRQLFANFFLQRVTNFLRELS